MKSQYFLNILTRFTLLGITLLAASCQDADNLEDDEYNTSHFNVTVFGQGLDCGDLFLIDVNNNIEELFKITNQEGWARCYAYGLAEEYKVPGLNLLVELRAPTNDEFRPCTAMGPGYPWVTVVEVIKIIDS
jgi:hypothetical protein